VRLRWKRQIKICIHEGEESLLSSHEKEQKIYNIALFFLLLRSKSAQLEVFFSFQGEARRNGNAEEILAC